MNINETKDRIIQEISEKTLELAASIREANKEGIPASFICVSVVDSIEKVMCSNMSINHLEHMDDIANEQTGLINNFIKNPETLMKFMSEQ